MEVLRSAHQWRTVQTRFSVESLVVKPAAVHVVSEVESRLMAPLCTLLQVSSRQPCESSPPM